MVQRFFVFAEIFPVLFFEPGRISGNPYTGVTSGRCVCYVSIPTGNDSVEIKSAILQIPVASPNNLNAAISEVLIEVWYSLFQCARCVFHTKGFGNHPQAKLLAL